MLQAIHDHLNFGLDIDKYDHLTFPGVVPRSFIGCIFISIVSYPFVALSNILNQDKFIFNSKFKSSNRIL